MFSNKNIVFVRSFEWGSEDSPEGDARYIAYWTAPDPDAPVDQASIHAFDGFKKWCAENVSDEWGLVMKHYAGYHIWFASKSDAAKFVADWY